MALAPPPRTDEDNLYRFGKRMAGIPPPKEEVYRSGKRIATSVAGSSRDGGTTDVVPPSRDEPFSLLAHTPLAGRGSLREPLGRGGTISAADYELTTATKTLRDPRYPATEAEREKLLQARANRRQKLRLLLNSFPDAPGELVDGRLLLDSFPDAVVGSERTLWDSFLRRGGR